MAREVIVVSVNPKVFPRGVTEKLTFFGGIVFAARSFPGVAFAWEGAGFVVDGATSHYDVHTDIDLCTWTVWPSFVVDLLCTDRPVLSE